MSDEEDAANVFAIPDFWKSSKLYDAPTAGLDNVDLFGISTKSMYADLSVEYQIKSDETR